MWSRPGVVAGVNIEAAGGCAAGRVLTWDIILTVEAPAGVALCPVPNDCDDARVQNATAAMTEAGDGAWKQPGGFLWRRCTLGERASDECDPTRATP